MERYEYWLFLAKELEENGEQGKALKWYECITDMYVECIEAWLGRGNILIHSLGLYEEAIFCFDTALELEPDNWKAWAAKGTAFFFLDQLNHALICYNKAIEINPDDACFWFNKGEVFKVMAMPWKALACYAKGLEICPGQPDAVRIKNSILKNLK